jgi:hypothetical protein
MYPVSQETLSAIGAFRCRRPFYLPLYTRFVETPSGPLPTSDNFRYLCAISVQIEDYPKFQRYGDCKRQMKEN